MKNKITSRITYFCVQSCWDYPNVNLLNLLVLQDPATPVTFEKGMKEGWRYTANYFNVIPSFFKLLPDMEYATLLALFICHVMPS